MGTKRNTKKRPTPQDMIAVAGLIVGLAGFAAQLINSDFPSWLATVSLLVLFLCLAYLVRPWLAPFVTRLHPYLVSANPWLAILLLLLTILILYHVWPRRQAVPILFDAAKSAVFNSSDHQRSHAKYIRAVGASETLTWAIADEGRTGSFHYDVNSTEEPHPDVCSGGYVAFYGQPCDRLQFRTLRFRCRITDAIGKPDVGVRLAVDDPTAIGDREKITYQIASLAEHGPVSEKWTTFELPIAAFKQVRYEPPFKGIDANTINKLVFYVDSRIAASCGEGTVWFSDVAFVP